MINWIHKFKKMPPTDAYLLTCYVNRKPVSEKYTYKIIRTPKIFNGGLDWQEICYSVGITHWAEITPPEECDD